MIFVIDSFYTNYVKPWTSHGKDLQTLCCSGLGNLSVAWILVEGQPKDWLLPCVESRYLLSSYGTFILFFFRLELSRLWYGLEDGEMKSKNEQKTHRNQNKRNVLKQKINRQSVIFLQTQKAKDDALARSQPFFFPTPAIHTSPAISIFTHALKDF